MVVGGMSLFTVEPEKAHHGQVALGNYRIGALYRWRIVAKHAKPIITGQPRSGASGCGVVAVI